MAVDPGLCASCAWSRRVESARGSVFLRCGRSDADPRYPRYPRLPVRACAGYERRATGRGSAPSQGGILEA